MTLFAILAVLAIVFFVAHVFLLFTSFGEKGFQKRKYFWSHATLWICGVIVFAMASLFAGQGVSAIADVFDTPIKRMLILAVVAALSLVAHTVVRLLVLPKFSGRSV
jgi:hypothetical protein